MQTSTWIHTVKIHIAIGFFLSLCFACSPKAETQGKVEIEGRKDLAGMSNLGKDTQVWKLVEMTGSMVNSQTVGENMDWQETYEFLPDGNFTKERIQDGKTSTATGKYRIQTARYGTNLILTYKDNSEIISTCTGTQEETLIATNNYKLQGTWSACDGPGLTYIQEK